MSTLEQARELDGATFQENDGRWYAYSEGFYGEKVYGYYAHFTGAYVCYTCGHMCECGEEE